MKKFFFYIAISFLAFGVSLGIYYLLFYKVIEPEKTQINLETNITNREEVKENISNKTKAENLICNDETIKPYWEIMKKDKYFRVYFDIGEVETDFVIDCADAFEIENKNLDINNNGIKEVIIKGKWGKNFCGMYSGCWYGVFEKSSGKISKLFVDGNVATFKSAKSKTNGYKDLITTSNGGVYGEYIDHLKFNGKIYKRKKCFIDSFNDWDKNGKPIKLKKSKISDIDCPTD